MAVTQAIYFRSQAQLASRRLFLACIHPEPACGTPSPSWTLTPCDSASISPNQISSRSVVLPSTNTPLKQEFES